MRSFRRSNRRGQSGLWGYAISGDLPIVLVQISDVANLELVLGRYDAGIRLGEQRIHEAGALALIAFIDAMNDPHVRIFLDAESRTVVAQGNPKDLLKDSKDPRVRAFLTRGEEDKKTDQSARDHG